MGVNNIFELGRQGIAANRQALTTTSNNVSNANTPGYSRQKPVFRANERFEKQGMFQGGGVDVRQVIRIHDDFVEKQLQDEVKGLGEMKFRSEGYKHLESLLNQDGFELGNQVNKFFNDYRELSSNPEAIAMRQQVHDSADAIVHSFRKLNDSMDDMKRDIDLRLEHSLTEVNGLTKELAGLNEKIFEMENVHQQPNEMYDRRDEVVRTLEQKLGMQVVVNGNGQVNFGTLVNGNEAYELVAARTPAHGEKGNNSLDIFRKDSMGMHQVTAEFKEGEVAGVLHVRDQVVNPTIARLDHAAFQLASAVNEVHHDGLGLDGKGERNLFKPVESVEGASRNFDLSEDVRHSFEAIATAREPNKPGDNRIALAVADLQNKALMPTDGFLGEGKENHHTLNESLNSLVGGIGTQTAKEDQLFRHQQGVVGQLDNYRQQTSGVSLEEEAMNMLQFQAAFNASAKTVKVGDEVLQTILSLKN
jgi:flagellar hook-associated protein 1